MSSNSQELPLFPLNAVIFPGGALPLRIFEPRYLDMVKDCMRDEHGFGIVLIKQGKESGQTADIYNTGTECRIEDWQTLPDGLLGITAYGECKFDIETTRVEKNKLLVGEIQRLEPNPDLQLPEEFLEMRNLLQTIITQVGEPYTGLPAAYDNAGWVGARLTELLPLQLATKQRFLEIDDHIVRLHHLKEAMQESKFL
ncbi:MAG: LON peptidase substrate-binding domain-containing protein [Pseudomonadota bacterium]